MVVVAAERARGGDWVKAAHGGRGREIRSPRARACTTGRNAARTSAVLRTEIERAESVKKTAELKRDQAV